jgi:hypothetical protein
MIRLFAEEDEQHRIVETQEVAVVYRLNSLLFSSRMDALPITVRQSLEILSIECVVHGRFVENVTDCPFALYDLYFLILGPLKIIMSPGN